MHHAAIVPEADGAVLPAETAGKLRPCRMVAEVLDERLAFLFRHIGEAVRADDVDEERLAAGLRMRDDDRMPTFRHVVVDALAHLAGTVGVALGRHPVRKEECGWGVI